MPKSSGQRVFKWRLSQGQVGHLSAVVVELIGGLRTIKRFSTNLSRSFNRVMHDLKWSCLIRSSGCLSPLCTAPYNNNN